MRHARAAPVPSPIRKHKAMPHKRLQEFKLFRRHLRVNQVFGFMDKVKKVIGMRAVHRHESRKRRTKAVQIILADFRGTFKRPTHSLLDKFSNAMVERI